VKAEIKEALIREFEKGLSSMGPHPFKTKKNIHFTLTVTPIKDAHRIAATVKSGGRRYFSFGTLVGENLEDL